MNGPSDNDYITEPPENIEAACCRCGGLVVTMAPPDGVALFAVCINCRMNAVTLEVR